ncbi:hypothetical protein OOJ91_34200 [Micromonospora lupini]|uniref:hypothetical protein n=1 Tax=Micromonospora lupini TaxID=285679 RepID=UPI00224DC931|nr:hypothetical protein [Micromonospora lupini]MCX5070902.1 hypothetical protein [Micromonospora lupini]
MDKPRQTYNGGWWIDLTPADPGVILEVWRPGATGPEYHPTHHDIPFATNGDALRYLRKQGFNHPDIGTRVSDPQHEEDPDGTTSPDSDTPR